MKKRKFRALANPGPPLKQQITDIVRETAPAGVPLKKWAPPAERVSTLTGNTDRTPVRLANSIERRKAPGTKKWKDMTVLRAGETAVGQRCWHWERLLVRVRRCFAKHPSDLRGGVLMMDEYANVFELTPNTVVRVEKASLRHAA